MKSCLKPYGVTCPLPVSYRFLRGNCHRTTNRTAIALRSPEDYLVEVSYDSIANGPRTQVLPVSSLIVKQSAEGIVVYMRDRSQQFDVIEFVDRSRLDWWS